MLIALSTLGMSHPGSCYYEHSELTYVVNPDRSVSASLSFTLVNLSRFSYQITALQKIPTTEVTEVEVRGDPGISHVLERTAENTTIRTNFTIQPNSRFNYHISYTARGWILGAGPTYRPKARFGGIKTGDFRNEDYKVKVRGPSGTRLFLMDPPAEIIENEPPIVEYKTRLDTNQEFEGLLTTFYSSPVYYKLTLVERIRNPSEEASDIVLDLLLFNHGQSQFAALMDSDPPLATMYPDEENNWYGAIELKLKPGDDRDVRLELIWACEVHSPEIDNRGTLDEIPGELFPYLKKAEFWETDDPSIALKASEIVGDEKNACRVAELIMGWVSDYLENRPIEDRQGALETLRKGYGDCDCFSDLTIALARTAGLPARLSFGWAYQEETISGHAWVELYLPRVGWQPADPAWAKTSGDYLFKLDPTHILRGRRGLTSSDSVIHHTFYGGDPRIAPETSSPVLLETPEAAQAFIQAAETTLEIANRLAAGNETVNPKLQLANQKLIEARSATGEDAIQLAQQSLQYSNEVIGALGKQLELEPRVYWWLFLVLAGAIVGGGIAVILAAVRG